MAKRILIVDDEATATALLRRRLESEGYECDECWDGAAALVKLGENKYDLVLLDYSMPNMKGDEVCQEAREKDALKSLPIIIVTAYSNKTEDFFKEEGATDVLYKPVDEDDLKEKIEKHIGVSA